MSNRTFLVLDSQIEGGETERQGDRSESPIRSEETQEGRRDR